MLVQDQKEMQGILLDAISEQIRGMQSITKLLTQKLETVRLTLNVLNLQGLHLCKDQSSHWALTSFQAHLVPILGILFKDGYIPASF